MPFLSAQELAIQAGEAHSVIRVTNLQTSAKIGTNAWGVSGKVQPILISVSVSLRQPFSTASKSDSVDGSTLHYGTLSKAILEAAATCSEDPRENFRTANKANTDSSYVIGKGTLPQFWNHIVHCVTGIVKDGDDGSLNGIRKAGHISMVIDAKVVRVLEVKILLPKASLLGSGASIYGTVLFKEGFDSKQTGSQRPESVLDLNSQTRGLRLHDLRIPTLVGVNDDERLAKQTVIANIDISSWILSEDLYAQLEEIVVKVESLFRVANLLLS